MNTIRNHIEIIPAMDIIGGKCVRLRQGAYDDQTVYDADPVETAVRFKNAGWNRLHLVDLDGAAGDRPRNLPLLRRLVRETGLKIEFGGGVKSPESLREVLEYGADRVICGSLAVFRPELFSEWLRRYGPDRILLGIDVKAGEIAVRGWKETVPETTEALLEKFGNAGLKTAVLTDISRDGMMQGPAVTWYERLVRQFPELEIIASGGVSCRGDIRLLERAGVSAVIVGKALYEGTIPIPSRSGDSSGNVFCPPAVPSGKLR